ncbi:hypothetical protein [Pseudoxanthomonas yeongjuensis]|uniref:hypothetical protein n=1 Tax=Pseudoxanthomonas yeongjuensis TaxID=377616 RepID=UPI001391B14A|nr:hypothetical protein [Pseudoxanthomonas yeongjuensis]
MIEPSTQVRQELHDLPEIPLPDALWRRVEAGRRLKIRQRKLFTGIASLALVAVLATPLLAPLFTDTDVLRSEPLAVHQPVRSEQDVHAELHAIDRALQAAYDRGASDAEIAPMWVVRNTLLADSQPRPAKPRIDRS